LFPENPGGPSFSLQSGPKTSRVCSSNGTSPNLKVYPNPAKDEVTIEAPQTTRESTLSIYNVNGQKLIKRQIKESKVQFNIRSLPNGIYIKKV